MSMEDIMTRIPLDMLTAFGEENSSIFQSNNKFIVKKTPVKKERDKLIEGHYDPKKGKLNLVFESGKVLEIKTFPTTETIGVGPTGPTGPTGENGHDGKDGKDGKKGIMGIPGTPGIPGKSGPPGPQGIKGKMGEQGPSGCSPVGDRGEKGKMGPTGPTGPTGPAGLNGYDGGLIAEGPSGMTGPTGPRGEVNVLFTNIEPIPIGRNCIWAIQVE